MLPLFLLLHPSFNLLEFDAVSFDFFYMKKDTFASSFAESCLVPVFIGADAVFFVGDIACVVACVLVPFSLLICDFSAFLGSFISAAFFLGTILYAVTFILSHFSLLVFDFCLLFGAFPFSDVLLLLDIFGTFVSLMQEVSSRRCRYFLHMPDFDLVLT